MKKILILLLILMSQKLIAQLPDFKKNGYKVLDAINGASLYSKTVRNKKANYTVFLHVIDLRFIKMGQWVSASNDVENAPQGLYLGVKKHDKSPFFRQHTPSKTISGLTNTYKSKLFGIINAAFYEQYTDTTQLSFPIKVDGEIRTAGSSPYGPQKNPKLPYYKKVVLKSMAWTDSTVVIQDYNPQSGYPLTDERTQNALVSYYFKDHPAYVLRAESPNLFYTLGTLSKDNTPSPYIFILTVNAATLDNAAAELVQLGIKSSIMTIDGGASVLIYNARKGNLMSPASRTLPHYLFFAEK